MAALFKDVPEALATTLEIAEKCDLKIVLGENKFPAYAVPEGETREGYLRRLCYEGLERRFPGRARRSPSCAQRLDFELDVLAQDRLHQLLPHRLGFHPLRQDATTSRSARAAAAPRAASSPTCSASPISIRSQYGLFFERFLNPGAHFAARYRRRLLLQPPRPKSSSTCARNTASKSVAQIITFGTLGAKMAIRDVGRVMGLSYGEADRLAKMIPFDPEDDAGKGAQGKPRFQARLRRGGNRARR